MIFLSLAGGEHGAMGAGITKAKQAKMAQTVSSSFSIAFFGEVWSKLTVLDSLCNERATVVCADCTIHKLQRLHCTSITLKKRRISAFTPRLEHRKGTLWQRTKGFLNRFRLGWWRQTWLRRLRRYRVLPLMNRRLWLLFQFQPNRRNNVKMHVS